MKAETVAKLLTAFDEQQDIIKAQGKIIDELFGLLSQHIGADELSGLPVVSEIEAVSKMLGNVG